MEWVGMPPSSQPEVSSPGGFGAVPPTCAVPSSDFQGWVEGGKRECGLTGNIEMALNR